MAVVCGLAARSGRKNRKLSFATAIEKSFLGINFFFAKTFPGQKRLGSSGGGLFLLTRLGVWVMGGCAVFYV